MKPTSRIQTPHKNLPKARTAPDETAQLRGLTDAELAEIQRSLKELTE